MQSYGLGWLAANHTWLEGMQLFLFFIFFCHISGRFCLWVRQFRSSKARSMNTRDFLLLWLEQVGHTLSLQLLLLLHMPAIVHVSNSILHHAIHPCHLISCFCSGSKLRSDQFRFGQMLTELQRQPIFQLREFETTVDSIRDCVAEVYFYSTLCEVLIPCDQLGYVIRGGRIRSRDTLINAVSEVLSVLALTQ